MDCEQGHIELQSPLVEEGRFLAQDARPAPPLLVQVTHRRGVVALEFSEGMLTSLERLRGFQGGTTLESD